jgi:hypothetical protein
MLIKASCREIRWVIASSGLLGTYCNVRMLMDGLSQCNFPLTSPFLRGEFVLIDYISGAVVEIKMKYTRGKTQLIHIGSQR